jgi:hypothetical protein
MPLLLELPDQNSCSSKTGFFRDTDSRHFDALDDWTRQRLLAFRLRGACQLGKCIEEICD